MRNKLILAAIIAMLSLSTVHGQDISNNNTETSGSAISSAQPADISKNNPVISGFSLLSNINRGQFDVIFNTSADEYTTVRIYGLDGRELKELFKGNLEAGSHSYHYDVNDLNSGMYVYLVSTGSACKVQRFYIK